MRQQVGGLAALLPCFSQLPRRLFRDLLLLFRQGVPQALRRGLLPDDRHGLLLQTLLRLAQFAGLLGERAGFPGLRFQHLGAGFRLFAQLLAQLLFHRLLQILPVLRDLLLPRRFRQLLGLARELLLLLGQFEEPRQLLDPLLLAVHLVPHLLELLHRGFRLAAGAVELLLALLLAILQRRALQILPRLRHHFRCLSYFLGLRGVDALLHPFRQCLQILLRLRQLLASFGEMLLGILAQLLVPHLAAMPIHPLAGFLCRPDRRLDRCPGFLVLGPQFLPRQRLGIAVDPDQQPLRMPDARSIEIRRTGVLRPDPQPEFTGSRPILQHLANRELALAAIPRRIRSPADLLRKIPVQAQWVLAAGLHLELQRLDPEILRHLVAQADHLVRPDPQLAGDRAQPADHRLEIIHDPDRKAQRVDLAAQAVLQPDHRVARSVFPERPRKAHPAADRRSFDISFRDPFAVDLDPCLLDRGIEISPELDPGPAHRLHPAPQGFLRGQQPGVFGISQLDPRIDHRRQGPDRHLKGIALAASGPRPVLETFPHRIHPVAPGAADPGHRLKDLIAIVEGHHQLELLRRAIVVDRDLDRVAFKQLDVARLHLEILRRGVAEVAERRHRPHRQPRHLSRPRGKQ